MGSGLRNIFGASVPPHIRAYQVTIDDGTYIKTINYQVKSKCDQIPLYFQSSNGGGYDLFEFDKIIEKSMQTKFNEICTYSSCKQYTNKDHFQKGGFQIHNKVNTDKITLEKIIDNTHPNEDTFLRSFLASGSYYVVLKNKNAFNVRLKFIPDEATYKYYESESQTVLRLSGRISTYYEIPNNRV
jgi:hypothetical protein